MDPIVATIAQTLKNLRQKRKLSLDSVARLTGVSKSMLAQLERGEVNPTVTTLCKIANGFKVPFTQFMTQESKELAILRCDDVDPLKEDKGRFRNYPLLPYDEQRRFEVYSIELDPGCTMQAEPHPPGSEEFITVTLGSVRLTVEDKEETLDYGDFVRFKADVPHGYANVGEDMCTLQMVIWYAPE